MKVQFVCEECGWKNEDPTKVWKCEKTELNDPVFNIGDVVQPPDEFSRGLIGLIYCMRYRRDVTNKGHARYYEVKMFNWKEEWANTRWFKEKTLKPSDLSKPVPIILFWRAVGLMWAFESKQFTLLDSEYNTANVKQRVKSHFKVKINSIRGGLVRLTLTRLNYHS